MEFGTAGDGRGIDREAAARLDAIAGAFRPALARTTASLGLEGEREVCFSLDELPAGERAEIVQKIQHEVGSARMWSFVPTYLVDGPAEPHSRRALRHLATTGSAVKHVATRGDIFESGPGIAISVISD